MNQRRVVVTGLGTVNPTGNSVSESWKAIREGQNGITPITRFDATNFKVKLAGEVKDFAPEKRMDKREARRMARFTQFALYAAEEAIHDSGILGAPLSDDTLRPFEQKIPAGDAAHTGVIISSGIGGIDVIEQEHSRGMEKGWERVSPFFIPMTICNMAAARVAISHGLKGICTCPVTACAGGSNAIGDAFHRIRDGYEEVMICGGTEAAITPLSIGGFSSMTALSYAEDPARGSIPFDAERNGFVMGEGSGILVLEELSHAQKRNAHIYAEIIGYGVNCDAYHITAPAPDGAGGAECMRLALKDAGITPDQINYINAHGTSTHLNDAGETHAIKTVFGEHARHLAVSSTKSMTGHLLGGAGGIEAVFSCMALQDQFIPPTINLKVPDPECDLDYVPGTGRNAALSCVLSNSLGFGGHNASLIFRSFH
ncbi:MAG: beta-ketoacyl-ACP synthase II [Butyrivibrio sp.]|jgi:3-oxoacyl-[acyl-carrier-protein] synthase II|nr:beta-ketoacyl-ACP synthase II [Butyrivibrio sp.]